MPDEDKYTREQELLMQLCEIRCGGNGAELARRLDLDATYVNRLFYPIGKKGRKGIGLKVMRAASEEFKLPPGFWEGADQEVDLGQEEPRARETRSVPTEYVQLLKDLEVLPKPRQAVYMQHIHRAAEEARDVLEHNAPRRHQSPSPVVRSPVETPLDPDTTGDRYMAEDERMNEIAGRKRGNGLK